MVDTFCPIPWNSQAIRSNGDVRLCCHANIAKNKGTLCNSKGYPYNAANDDLVEARNSNLIRSIRQNMLEGKWSEECNRCKSEEQSGLNSKRNYEKERWRMSLEDVADTTANDGTIDTDLFPTVYYDIRFGNLCNLACRMCGPQDSNGWYSDWNLLHGKDWFNDTHGREQMYKQKNKWVSDSYNWHSSDSFWKQIESNSKNVKHVYMAGGEPMLIERHYEFLERCIENGAAKNMVVEYNTNMTSIPTRVLDLWQHFKAIEIGASIDGYGSVQEYQRYPSEWKKILKNIYKVDAAPNNISAWFAYTVTAYNVLHLPDFMRWKLESSGLNKFNNSLRRPIVTHHLAYKPLYLNIRVLPKGYKSLVKERFDQFRNWMLQEKYPEHVLASSESIYKSVINYMMSEDYHNSHWEEFCDYTNKLDQIRNQQILDVIPQLREYL